MNSRTLFTCVLATFFLVLPCAAGTVEGLPLHVKEIGPGAIRVWVGDHISSTAVCAIATKKGIVVIDTTNIPKLDLVFRKVIAKEFGRNDFAYLINTHGHSDHTSGNGVYADCPIVAHKNVKALMAENFANTAQRIVWSNESVKEQKAQLEAGKVKEEEKAATNEQLIISTLVGEYLNSSPKPTFPTKIFTDKLVLDCGDTTFELFQSGGTHTNSDIFIFVPQKGILFTGDMMADKWLTNSPGCLATFAVRSGTVEDYPVLVKNWRTLLDRKAEIKQYIPGHWNGELSCEGFKNRFDYLQTLLADVKTLIKAEGDFNQFISDYSLKNKFPHLVNSPGISDRGHLMSIAHLYKLLSGKISVADKLQELIRDNTFSAEFGKLKENILKAREKYFYTEIELNGQGYVLLNQQKQVEDAIKLFEFNIELFPKAWNAYDSLAEAYYQKGDKQKALKLYRKSLELNPDNENGKKFIQRIENELAH